MPLLFYEDIVPWVKIGHFDERSIVYIDMIRGFRPQTKIRIFIFIFDLCSLEGKIRVFVFGRVGTTPMTRLDKGGADALESTVLDEEIADGRQASGGAHPALRGRAY